MSTINGLGGMTRSWPIAALLTQMDADGDGSLSSDELGQGLGELMPPPSSTLAFAQATSTDYDPLDLNQDGTVSEIERLAGQLKELADATASEATQDPATAEIAQLAQKLYDQIAKNWLQGAAAAATSLSTTA